MESTFVHPGILHAAADLDRMREGARQTGSPIAAGFERLRDHPLSNSDYAHHDFGKEIGRNPSVNFPAFDEDCTAAYQCALMAAITGDKRYALTSQRIVLGWSNSLQVVSGADAVLMAGLGPFKLINAAEILRAGGDLDPAGIIACQRMLRRAILPTIVDFAPFANGNWDTAAIKTMLAIAVFCDDRDLFERALLYYLHGDGDGRLEHYVYDNGQYQESGRDQQHTQLGLAHMADACEIAWHQSLDLYCAMENRLLKGFEYTASYNLGDEVSFRPDIDRTGKYRHQVLSPRSALRPIYEQVLAHFHVRKGLPTPAVERAVAKLRPEGAGHGADQTGFGTLLYERKSSDVGRDAHPASPAALHAEANGPGIDITWLAPGDAQSYSIERAEADGSYRRIQDRIVGERFTDAGAAVGKLYRYRIVAHGSATSAVPSLVTRISRGLQRGLTDISLGSPAIRGSAQFDGNVLTIHAGGTGLMQPADEGHLVYAAADCHALQARFLPQVASQSAIFGAMHRQGLLPGAPCVALLVSPGPGDRERHGWHVRSLVRDDKGVVQIIADHPLEEPIVQFGRLMRPVWLRLERKQARIHADFSIDGAEWTGAGDAPVGQHGVLGLAASSGIAEVNTAVRFDSIALSATQIDAGA
jgi:hypothetical protein